MDTLPLLGGRLVAFVATRHPSIAKAFYRDKLRLTLTSEDAFALVFDVQGTMLRVTTVREIAVAAYTVLGWHVADIAAAVKNLMNAGIRLERYKGLPQDDLGIWTTPDGAKVAWFKDPDGNVLSITQF
ncbi:MAG: VOC family protein [Bryobacteraceae bacterium]